MEEEGVIWRKSPFTVKPHSSGTELLSTFSFDYHKIPEIQVLVSSFYK
jgi:hypothetical protein